MADFPAQVPPDRVVDFDFYMPTDHGGDPFLAWRRLHEGPDIVWTPRNGGH